VRYFDEDVQRRTFGGVSMKFLVAAVVVALVVPWPGLAAEESAGGELPDLDVTHISRTPRYPAYEVDYPEEGELRRIAQLKAGTENDKRWPDKGERVTFTAHVANKGSAKAPKFGYVWRLDGKQIGRGTLGPVKPGETVTAETTWAWTMRRHTIEFVDAFALLMGVHRTTYESFNANANVTGTYSFEDWVQFHVDYMNMLLERSRSQLAPRGMLDRIRADAFVVVEDVEEKNAVWSGEHEWCAVKGATHRQGFDGAWYFGERADCSKWAAEPDWGLLHEWGHQLGMIDNYQLNVECWGNTVRELDGTRVRVGHDFSDQEKMMHWHGPNLFHEATVVGMRRRTSSACSTARGGRCRTRGSRCTSGRSSIAATGRA
jgi:hypothetical protein